MAVASPNQEINPHATTNNLISGLSVTVCVDAVVRRIQTSGYPMRIGDVGTAFSDSVVTVSPIPA